MFLKEKRRRAVDWKWRNRRIVLILYGLAALLYIHREFPNGLLAAATPTPAPLVEESGPNEQALDHLARAELYLDQGNLIAAMEAYQEAIAAEPEEPALAIAYARWGQILTIQGKEEEALIRTERAVALAPNDAEVLSARAMALEWSGDLPEAIRLAQQAIDSDPANASGYAFLAEAYVDSARYEEALELAQRATELDPDNVWAWRNLGYVRESRAEYDAAIDAYREALLVKPLSFLYLSLGRNLLNHPQRPDSLAALEQFRQATVVDPRNPLAYADIANTYYLQEDYSSALDYVDRGLAQEPSFARFYVLKGTIFYVQRNFEGSIEQLEQAVSYGASTEDVFYLLGLAHAYLEQCDQALPWLQRALDLNPGSSPAQAGMELCGGATAQQQEP